MKGQVGHFELPAEQPERARKFYSEVFGWKMMPMPGFDYTMVTTGPADEKGMPVAPGYIGGGIGPRGPNLQHPVITILVDDLEEAEKVVVKHGGRILRSKRPIGDGSMGHTGYFRDPEGNVVGLYQPPTP